MSEKYALLLILITERQVFAFAQYSAFIHPIFLE